jgi:hypothetical protein
MKVGRHSMTFRRNAQPPSSGPKSKPSRQTARGKDGGSTILRNVVDFLPGCTSHLHDHRYENLKSNIAGKRSGSAKDGVCTRERGSNEGIQRFGRNSFVPSVPALRYLGFWWFRFVIITIHQPSVTSSSHSATARSRDFFVN